MPNDGDGLANTERGRDGSGVADVCSVAVKISVSGIPVAALIPRRYSPASGRKQGRKPVEAAGKVSAAVDQ